MSTIIKVTAYHCHNYTATWLNGWQTEPMAIYLAVWAPTGGHTNDIFWFHWMVFLDSSNESNIKSGKPHACVSTLR